MKRGKTVFVGLSGGVDSSVAALRLKKQGYSVVGVFIKVWHPDFMVCNWEQERLDAMRVAAHLEIPFLTCDAEAEYRDEVAKYFIEEYKAGRTPNPDVMCNKSVKFGAFMRFAQQKAADFIATGHYAQRVDVESQAQMHRGVDISKDQTYFLWTLSNKQLEYSLFPVGDTSKEKIREEAEKARIPVAQKQDSQGICFLGHVDIPDFISHYTELTTGPVLDETGKEIGTHKGALVYTLGQRHGFTLKNNSAQQTARYIVAKNVNENTITVSVKKPVSNDSDKVALHSLRLRSSVFEGDLVEAQFRYRQKPFSISLSNITDSSAVVHCREEVETPSAGQSCVLYRGTECLGGGIIV